MSDNIPPDLIQKELDARLRIPNEVWTDVFKLLPRRVLVQIVSPVCYRFKEICDKNVKNIHVIKNAVVFYCNLKEDYPKSVQQLEHLAGNSCQLAGQFRLTNLWIDEKSQAILRHCPDLFVGCKITTDFSEGNDPTLTLFLECLSQLQNAKPVQIDVSQGVDRVDQVVDFWHHPTFKNCTRVHLTCSFLTPVSMTTLVVNIFEWLHHQPSEMDCYGNAADQQQVRCMIIVILGREYDQIDWLLNRCSQVLQESREPIDRRPFVLNFDCSFWYGFRQFRRIENKSTREVLVLDRVLNAHGRDDHYRLRRCLAEEEAYGPDFYGMITRETAFGGYEDFNIDNETPKVTIKR